MQIPIEPDEIVWQAEAVFIRVSELEKSAMLTCPEIAVLCADFREALSAEIDRKVLADA